MPAVMDQPSLRDPSGARRPAGMMGRVKRLLSQLHRRSDRRSHLVLFVVPGGSGGFAPINLELYRDLPAFRESIDSSSAIIEGVLGWNPAAAFRGTLDRSATVEIERRNEIVHHGMARIALIDAWRSEGITPDGAVGVSLGEVVAPYAVGAITRDECARLVAVVSEGVNGPVTGQRVYVIAASPGQARRLCFEAPVPVDFLGASTPGLSLLIASESETEVVREHLGERIVKEAPSGWRYHTPDMYFRQEWAGAQLGDGIVTGATERPIYSSAIGGPLPAGTRLDARTIHWMMGSPSHFAEAVSAALGDGFDVAVQIAAVPLFIFADVGKTAEAEQHEVQQFQSIESQARRAVRAMRRGAMPGWSAAPPAKPELDADWWNEVRRQSVDPTTAAVCERLLEPLVARKPFDIVAAFADRLADACGVGLEMTRRLLTSSVLAMLQDDGLRRHVIDGMEKAGAIDEGVDRPSVVQDDASRTSMVAISALKTMLRLAPDFAVFQPLIAVHRVHGEILQLVIAR
jgi:hypothetical protein